MELVWQKFIYLINFLFSNEISLIINLIIIGLLIIAFLWGRHHIKRYKSDETSDLKKAMRKIDESLQQVDSALDADNDKNMKNKEASQLNRLINIENLMSGLDRNSIIYKRIETILKMRKRRVKISVEMLQQETANLESSKPGINLLIFSANLVILLGLLGTFMGFALLVEPLHSVTAQNLGSLNPVVEALFRGIHTAFSTSIIGVCAATICYVMNYRLRHAQNKFMYELESFTLERLLPAIVPAVEEEHLIERVTFQLENSFDFLNNIFNQNSENLTRLNAVQNSFKEIVQDIRNITKREAARNFEQVLGRIIETNSLMAKIIETWPKLTKIAEIDRKYKAIDKLISQLFLVKKDDAILYPRTMAWSAIFICVVIILFAIVSLFLR